MQRLTVTDTINKLPQAEKDKIRSFFSHAEHIAVAAMYIKDKYTGKGTGKELIFKRAGNYEWTSDVEYYFDKYDMVLPEEFTSMVLSTWPAYLKEHFTASDRNNKLL